MTGAAPLDIAIMDKNPHVREFLCRELSAMGYLATAVQGVGELLQRLGASKSPQVLVLDPEAAGTRLAEVAHGLRGCAARLAVVLHVFDGSEPVVGFDGALVVERQPHMGALKAALAALAAQIQQRAGAAGATGPCGTQERA